MLKTLVDCLSHLLCPLTPPLGIIEIEASLFIQTSNLLAEGIKLWITFLTK
jgi:hypothetical protein